MKATLRIFHNPVQELGLENRSASKELAPPPAPPGTADLIALQKLLADIEARAITRVHPPYLMQPLPPTRTTRSVRTLVALLWAMSLVLCVFVVKYLDTGITPPAADPAQARSISNLTATVSDQNQQFSRLVDSMQTLANAVATSSVRTTAMQAVLRRLGRDSNPTDSQPIIRRPEFAPTMPPPALLSPPKIQSLFQNNTPSQNTPAWMGAHRHDPVEDVIAPHNVIVHHNEDGVMDYWLVPRIVSGSRTLIKLMPISQTNMGIFVHSIDEVRDYVITPSGDWLAASDPN
jgi:hypothetical protein